MLKGKEKSLRFAIASGCQKYITTKMLLMGKENARYFLKNNWGKFMDYNTEIYQSYYRLINRTVIGILAVSKK